MVIDAIEQRREGRDFDRLIFWARPPGIDIETSSRSLELMATEVLPHFSGVPPEADVKLANGLGDLAYSTLVHPADDWDELWASLQEYVPEVKRRVSPDVPSAVSLRLSAATVERLLADQSALADLRSFLAAEDLYVITANAFPYGPFKNRLVMETVFEPDWRDRRRVEYTRGRRNDPRVDRRRRREPDDPDGAARLQAARHAGRRRALHRPCRAGRGPPRSDWRVRPARRCAWGSSRSRSATWRRRRRRSTTSVSSCSPKPPRPTGDARRERRRRGRNRATHPPRRRLRRLPPGR